MACRAYERTRNQGLGSAPTRSRSINLTQNAQTADLSDADFGRVVGYSERVMADYSREAASRHCVLVPIMLHNAQAWRHFQQGGVSGT